MQLLIFQITKIKEDMDFDSLSDSVNVLLQQELEHKVREKGGEKADKEFTRYGDTCPNCNKSFSVFWTKSPATTPWNSIYINRY